MVIKQRSYFLFVFLFVATGLYAQLPGQNHEIKRYLTGNIPVMSQNWGVSQDPSNRLMYFANSGGLVQFNGISATTYQLPFGKKVRSVLVDQKGNIFTGSFEEIGYWSRGNNCRLVYHSLASDTALSKNDEIWKIYQSNGSIYFQSFTTIYVYDYKQIKAIKAPSILLFLFQVQNKFIAQALGTGLFRFDGNKFSFIEGSEIFKTKKVHAIVADAAGGMLICTANDGIYRFDGRKFMYVESAVSSFLKYYSCNAGVAVNDSLFAFGTILNGLVLSDSKGQIKQHYSYANGLRDNTVLSLYMDYNRGLWIGLDNGANFINTASPYAYYYNPNRTLGTIYATLKDGPYLYIGTNHGLFAAEVLQNTGEYSFNNIRFVPSSQGQVWFLEKHNGQVLCGHNEGTFVVDGMSFRQLSDMTGGWAIRPFSDFLLEGTYTGIAVFNQNKKGEWNFRNRIVGYNEPTRHLETDYLGYVWASHFQKGIYQLELNEQFDSVLHSKYFPVVGDKPLKADVFKVNNKIVFTTTDKLYTYDYEQKKIVLFEALNKSMGDYASASRIIKHSGNQWWFVAGSKMALFEISREFNAVKKYEMNAEDIDLPEMEKQVIMFDEESFLVPASQGFSIYNSVSLVKDDVGCRLLVSAMHFKGKENSISFDQFGPDITIEAPYTENNLEVEFSYPCGFEHSNKTFMYRLDGVDNIWHETSLDKFSYLNLHFGLYKLTIKTTDNKAQVQVIFRIHRPWYLKWYAFLLYALVFAGFAYVVYWIFKFELKKQKQLIEYELKKNKLESELDYKSYELLLTMRYLIQKNEILTHLQEQITTLKDSASKYPIKNIREIEKVIGEGLETQTEEWKTAMNTLKLSEQGFFKKMKEKYPHLTTNDLRLCSYLRMNFNTKEIAKLVNISPRAVEISRYRLRKKMNLGHEVNLTEFLLNENFE